MNTLLQHAYGPSAELLRLVEAMHRALALFHGWAYDASYIEGVHHAPGEGLGAKRYYRKENDPPPLRWEGGLRFRLMLEHLRKMEPGEKLTWWDGPDSFWSDAGRAPWPYTVSRVACDDGFVGMVACPGALCTGAIYLDNTPFARRWLTRCLEILAKEPTRHLDLVATEAGIEDGVQKITTLPPEWNSFSHAIGELTCAPVVRAWHGERFAVKKRAMENCAKQGSTLHTDPRVGSDSAAVRLAPVGWM